MDINEIRGNTVDQLKDQLLQLKKEQLNLRFQQKSGELENSSRIRQVRRSIAQVMTVMTELKQKSKVGV